MRSFFRVFLEQFEDYTLRVMLVAAALTLLVGLDSEDDYKWIEGVSIFFAIGLITVFATTCNYLKEKQFLKIFDQLKSEEINAIRGQYGLSQAVKVFDVVVGDVIMIEAGMRVPADCILISGSDVTVDEAPYLEDRECIVHKAPSIMLSESSNNHKENPDPFLLSKSLVMTGSGKAVVCCVGKNT
jgi:magnesium-transporting ATPase (P-type)